MPTVPTERGLIRLQKDRAEGSICGMINSSRSASSAPIVPSGLAAEKKGALSYVVPFAQEEL